MDYTKNYHLPQWIESDRIMMEDFNAAMASLEKGLTDGKEALETGLKENKDQVDSLIDTMGKGGHLCRTAWGTYTGNGISTRDNPTRITCDFTPVVVFIQRCNDNAYDSATLIREMPRIIPDPTVSYAIQITWAEQEVSFYSENPEGGPQLNFSGEQYYYVVLGYDSNSQH